MRISKFNFEKRIVVFVSWYDKDDLVSEQLLATCYCHSFKEIEFMKDFYRKNYHNIERVFTVEFVKDIPVQKLLKSCITIKEFDTL